MIGNQIITNGLTKRTLQLKKYYYSVDTSDGVNSVFQRYAYKLISDTQNLTLVHHLGDNRWIFLTEVPKNSNYYFRILPSYIKSCEGKVAVEKGNVVYKREIASIKDDEPLGVPSS